MLKLELPDARVWLVDLGVEPPPTQCEWLDANERAQALRFAFEADRRRYRAAHVALRGRLGEQLGVPPAHLSFDRTALGKPRLAPGGCEFNMSHTADTAALVVCARPVGIDIEHLHPIDDLEGLARRCFTPAERRELAAPGVARTGLFLHGWTRKEACLKAVGCGLLLEPAEFETGLAPQDTEVSLRWEGAEHRLRLVSFRHGAIVGAVAQLLPTRSD